MSVLWRVAGGASLLAGVALATGWVGVLLSGLPCVGIRSGWLDSAGSVASSCTTRSPCWPRSRSSRADRRPPPASRGARLRSEPQPTLPRHHLGEWRRTFAGFGLGFGLDGPSRPRRCPRPASWRGAGLDAKLRVAAPAALGVIDERSAFGAARARGGVSACATNRGLAEGVTRARPSRQRAQALRRAFRVKPSGCVAMQAAGIDAASMARRGQNSNQTRECFSQPTEVLARQGGLGFRAQARPTRSGWRPPVRPGRS